MSGAKRNVLGFLGLSLTAVLSLMALMVAEAHASKESWLVNGVDLQVNKLVEVKLHTVLGFDVPKEANLEISCFKSEQKDLLLIIKTTTATGELWFSECKTVQSGEVKVSCTPAEPILISIKVSLILHEGKNYMLFEPMVGGGNFTQIKFKSPCKLAETNNVSGSFVAECLKAANLEPVDCGQEEKRHLLRQAPEALFVDKITFRGNPASLLGVVAAELSTGEPWCGHI